MGRAVLGACALALVAAILACGGSDDPPGDSTTVDGDATTPNDVTETPSGPATPFVDVCQPNPDPATPEEVRIDEPKAGDTLDIPAIISGTITGSEDRYRVSIFDAGGHTIARATLDNEGGTPQPFSQSLNYYSEESFACVWVYEITADEAPVNVALVPVGLPPPE